MSVSTGPSRSSAALAPELVAELLDLGVLLSRLSRLGAGDSNQNEKEPGDE